MSIKVMTMVFERYPAGGNERLLALALADHARDDGTRIWPSVSELARKTLQSERTVQRQIAHMVDRGWLLVVRKASGRPGDTNEYRVHPNWIAGTALPAQTGVNLSPVSPSEMPPESVDNVIHTGDTVGETGDKSGETGDTAMSPESSGTVKNRNTPLPPAEAGDCGKPRPRPGADQRAEWRWRDSFEGVCRRGAKLGMPYSTAPLGTAWTDDQLRAHQAAYRGMVIDADERHRKRTQAQGEGGTGVGRGAARCAAVQAGAGA